MVLRAAKEWAGCFLCLLACCCCWNWKSELDCDADECALGNVREQRRKEKKQWMRRKKGKREGGKLWRSIYHHPTPKGLVRLQQSLSRATIFSALMLIGLHCLFLGCFSSLLSIHTYIPSSKNVYDDGDDGVVSGAFWLSAAALMNQSSSHSLHPFTLCVCLHPSRAFLSLSGWEALTK
jgi:hypothetical protein